MYTLHSTQHTLSDPFLDFDKEHFLSKNNLEQSTKPNFISNRPILMFYF
jgi:hypothetical protein